MGNKLSSAAATPPPPPTPPIPVLTVPVQRTGVQDGASGLHYSGRVYLNQFQQTSENICKGTTASVKEINDVYPTGISNPSLPIDPTTKRVSASALEAYIKSLITSKQVPGEIADFNKQIVADKAFYESVQKEYCFYEARYVAALTQFLTLISNPQGANPTSTDTLLQQTVALNSRLNSLLEIVGHVGNARARRVTARSTELDAANKQLDDKIGVLARQKDILESGDVHVRTQTEMMRFSAEKNRAMSVQIMFFVALNVVALGTVLTVYKNIGK